MQARAGTLAQGIEALNARLSVEIDLDATTHIVGCRAHGYIVGSDVDPHRETLLIDVREMMARLFRILVGHVKTDMVQTMNLHLLIDSARHNITRSQ